MKVLQTLFGIGAITLLFSCTLWNDAPADESYTLVYRSHWRDGIDPKLTIQAPNPESIHTVAMSEFNGVALKASINRSDNFAHVANGTPRAEIAFDQVSNFVVGSEYEVRWSTLIPTRYAFDSQQPEIISQLLQRSYIGSPPFSLMLDNESYTVDIRSGPKNAVHAIKFGSPKQDEGKVVLWLLRYRPDDTGRHARTDLYKDGVRVVHCDGCPNAYAGETRTYLKVGIYKWWWQSRPSDVVQRTIYFGDVEIRERVLRP